MCDDYVKNVLDKWNLLELILTFEGEYKFKISASCTYEFRLRSFFLLTTFLNIFVVVPIIYIVLIRIFLLQFWF